MNNQYFTKDLDALASELVAQPHLAAGMVFELRQALQDLVNACTSQTGGSGTRMPEAEIVQAARDALGPDGAVMKRPRMIGS